MKLAVGTAQFGLSYGVANKDGQVPFGEARSILSLAAENDINTLDTAVAYGESERRLGEIGVQGWKVITKLPELEGGGSDMEKQVEQIVGHSLSNLRCEKLYGLLLHRPHQLLGRGGRDLYNALVKQKLAGRVLKIGLSIYSPSELDTICGKYPVDLVQAPFNPLDQRMIETGWLYRLTEEGTEFHARSLFLQGLLLMGERPAKFSRWSSLWAQWDAWLRTTGQTPVQACIQYASSFPEISCAVVGVNSARQLQEIIDAQQCEKHSLPSGLVSGDSDLVNPARWAFFE